MHFVVHCLDVADSGEKRTQNFAAHRAHLADPSVTIVLAGPLVAPDGETNVGSLFVIEAASKDVVVDFNARDPFTKAGIWKEVQIHPFLKRVDNRT